MFSSRNFIFLGIIFCDHLNSCGCGTYELKCIFFHIWISNFLAPLPEKTTSTYLFPLNYFYVFVESQLTIYWLVILDDIYILVITGLSILFYYLSVCLHAQTMLSWLIFFYNFEVRYTSNSFLIQSCVGYFKSIVIFMWILKSAY